MIGLGAGRQWAHRTIQRLRAPFSGGGLILSYHRVAQLSIDPFQLAVAPDRFDEHLSALGRLARPMSLTQLVAALQHRRVPRRAVAVTFDDGYADNLYAARPALERHDIPASVYVATGYVGTSHEFWWDELERILLSTVALPQALRLEIAGKGVEWELGADATVPETTLRASHGWQVWQPPPTNRHRLFRTLHHLLMEATEEDRQAALRQMRAWSRLDSLARPSHRILTTVELSRLADGRLIEGGAHGITHSRLPGLSSGQAQHEIAGSKTAMEEYLGRPVFGFAYPYGAYDAETAVAVRRTGYTHALGVAPARIEHGRADLYGLPRVSPGNWDGDRFSRVVESWLANGTLAEPNDSVRPPHGGG